MVDNKHFVENEEIDEILSGKIHISSAFRQTLFREVGAGHSLLDLRKIIHIFSATLMMLPKVDHTPLKERWSINYQKNLEIIESMKLDVGELWALLDSFGFSKHSYDKFLGTKEYQRYIQVTLKLMNNYPLLIECYVFCISDKQFTKWSIPHGYLFDFYAVIGKTTVMIRAQDGMQ